VLGVRPARLMRVARRKTYQNEIKRKVRLMPSHYGKKMSPKQKKMAAAADPKDKITGADFKSMKKKKSMMSKYG
jgi:hypothetical protein